MPLIRPCCEPDCTTLTMGERCLAHELAGPVPAVTRVSGVASAALLAALAGLLAAALARVRLSV